MSTISPRRRSSSPRSMARPRLIRDDIFLSAKRSRLRVEPGAKRAAVPKPDRAQGQHARTKHLEQESADGRRQLLDSRSVHGKLVGRFREHPPHLAAKPAPGPDHWLERTWFAASSTEAG